MNKVNNQLKTTQGMVKIALVEENDDIYVKSYSTPLQNNVHVQQLMDSLNQALKTNTVLKIVEHLDKIA